MSRVKLNLHSSRERKRERERREGAISVPYPARQRPPISFPSVIDRSIDRSIEARNVAVFGQRPNHLSQFLPVDDSMTREREREAARRTDPPRKYAGFFGASFAGNYLKLPGATSQSVKSCSKSFRASTLLLAG